MQGLTVVTFEITPVPIVASIGDADRLESSSSRLKRGTRRRRNVERREKKTKKRSDFSLSVSSPYPPLFSFAGEYDLILLVHASRYK